MPTKKVAPKKVAAKKPVAKKAATLFTTLTTLIPNWGRIPSGSKFKGTIREKKVEGRIYKDRGSIYLCQNVIAGSAPEEMLGFKYGWAIGNGSPAQFARNETTITSITLDPAFKVPKIIDVVGYRVVFNKGNIQIGCKTISNATVKKIASMLK